MSGVYRFSPDQSPVRRLVTKGQGSPRREQLGPHLQSSPGHVSYAGNANNNANTDRQGSPRHSQIGEEVMLLSPMCVCFGGVGIKVARGQCSQYCSA